MQDLGVRWPCHKVQRARGHHLPILLHPLGACPRQKCHCPQLLELLVLPKQAPIWAEHWEALPNLEDRGGDLEKNDKISHRTEILVKIKKFTFPIL